MHAHFDSSYKGSQTMTLVCKEEGERAGGGGGRGRGAGRRHQFTRGWRQVWEQVFRTDELMELRGVGWRGVGWRGGGWRRGNRRGPDFDGEVVPRLGQDLQGRRTHGGGGGGLLVRGGARLRADVQGRQICVDVVCGRLCARLCLRVRVFMPGYKYRHIYGCRGGGHYGR